MIPTSFQIADAWLVQSFIGNKIDSNFNTLKVYKNYFPDVPFENFFHWGEIMFGDFNEIDLGNIFLLLKSSFLDKGFKLILIRSRRTPDNIIDFAKKFFLNLILYKKLKKNLVVLVNPC